LYVKVTVGGGERQSLSGNSNNNNNTNNNNSRITNKSQSRTTSTAVEGRGVRCNCKWLGKRDKSAGIAANPSSTQTETRIPSSPGST
jgi:hypothetical protein